MTAGVRVTAFAALLAAIFAAAALAGRTVGPSAEDPEVHGGAEHANAANAGHAGAADAEAPGGLALAQDGYRLVADSTTLRARRPARFRFRIVDSSGATVRGLRTEQGRRMHLLVVRRDLRRFQHLHPRRDAGGAWSAQLELPAAGVYRALADFHAGGERRTLGIDLFVPGDFQPLRLPPASTRAVVDGYGVTLREDDGGRRLRFAVEREGAPLSDLQPYLGAGGHLVALRAGDLAYRHVHPEGAGLVFDSDRPEPGTYRLFLQFRHRGRVHTAAFTRQAPR